MFITGVVIGIVFILHYVVFAHFTRHAKKLDELEKEVGLTWIDGRAVYRHWFDC